MSDMQFEGFGEDQPFEGFGDDESFEGFEGRATLNNEGNNLEDEKGIVNSSDILSYQGNDSKAVASLVPKATSSDKVSAKKKTKGDDHLQKTENVYQSQDNIVDTPSFKEETLNKTSSDRTDEKVTQKQSKTYYAASLSSPDFMDMSNLADINRWLRWNQPSIGSGKNISTVKHVN
ncbi:hypothetical protein QYM36_015434 [Artemia franciscana]|uniref:Uncharacterized protein n=1 Tax=Artemia franciscana TaxID=6661 RepID=A0AA88HEZ5_ARTSF|nr:hypothetical protein QYM36_015434 [Artemia franciscana]